MPLRNFAPELIIGFYVISCLTIFMAHRRQDVANENANPPLPPSALGLIFAGFPVEVKGQWFHRQRISLDGYKFEKCRFDNCELVTDKGTFAIDHSFFQGCSFLFTGEAQRVVKLFHLTLPMNVWSSMGLRPYFNDDGTLSII